MPSKGIEYRKKDGGYVVSHTWKCTDAYVTIPSEHKGLPVVGIGKGAFIGKHGLEGVYIPATVRHIGKRAFYNCPNLKEVCGAEGVEKIGEEAFYGCEALERFTVPAGVSEIGGTAFFYCFGLAEVRNLSSLDVRAGSHTCGYVAEHAVNVYSDPSDAGSFVRGKGGLRFYVYGRGGEKRALLTGYDGDGKDLVLPEDFRGIPYDIGAAAFKGCGFLESVYIPGCVKRICDGAFYDCESLKRVDTPDIGSWLGIGLGDVFSAPLWSGADLYAGGKKVEDLVVPEGTEEIGDYAFYGYTGIRTVTFPASLRHIGYGAFSHHDLRDGAVEEVRAESLASWCAIDFEGPDSNPLSYGCRFLVDGEELPRDLVIPDGTEEIGDYAFSGGNGSYSVTLPESLSRIGEKAFSDCTRLVEVRNLSSLCLRKGDTANGCVARHAKKILGPGEEGGVFFSLDGYDFYDAGDTLTLLGYSGEERDLVLPTVEGRSYDVAPDAFRSGTFSSVTVPDCVEEIGRRAFYHCDSLTRARLGDGVRVIGDEAFGCDEALEEADFGRRVTYIGDDAFEDCRALSSVSFPHALRHIGKEAFLFCDSLSGVVLPENVRFLGWLAFDVEDGALYFFGDWETAYDAALAGTDPETGDPEYLDCNYPEILCYSPDEPPEGETKEAFWHYDEAGKPVRWGEVPPRTDAEGEDTENT